MTARTDDDVVRFSAREVAFAASLAAKTTIVEAGESVDRGERWAYKELKNSAVKYDRLKEILEPFCQVNKRKLKEMAADQADAALEALVGSAIGVIQEALEQGDIKTALEAADKVLNRVKGKPTSTVNVNQSGKIDHNHIHKHYVTPITTLQEFDRDVLADSSLYARARKITRGDRTEAIDISAKS